MRDFIGYLKDYFRSISLKNFLLTLVFTAVLVSLNYTLGLESRIRALSPWPLSLFIFFGFYLMVFGIAYCLQSSGILSHSSARSSSSAALSSNNPGPAGIRRLNIRDMPDKRSFSILLLLGPLFFSLKMIHWDLSFLTGPAASGPWSHYWLLLLQLPVKLAVMLGLLYLYWWFGTVRSRGDNRLRADNSFYGLTVRNFSALPYFQILLLLAPLVAVASTQHDFLLAYPKMKNISFLEGYAHPAWPWRLLYELSYGLDFVSIELFFRGFLVLGFVRFAGIHAILPMAAFYCTIHFGKPLGECISSFFGGLALGVIAWRSRTILGGLIVHLGLAWMMEIGGWLGNLFAP